MKNRINQMAVLSALTLTFLASPLVSGETVTTTTTAAGSITEVSPEALVIHTETDAAPLRYTVSRSTTYVDEAGAPVSPELVRSGLPVTVSYVRDGDRMIARRVIVRREVSQAAPTVIERNTTITPAPVVVEKKVFVDRPVPVEKRVYVDRPVVVEKPVIVEKEIPTAPPLHVIEKKTTTTTTTTK